MISSNDKYSIPACRQTSEISVRFNTALAKNKVPQDYQNHYRKWLRYYLDFCQKYNFQSIKPESLQNFLRKLGEKRQTREQQKQASHAISLFYNFNFDTYILTVHDGKGKKDRTVSSA